MLLHPTHFMPITLESVKNDVKAIMGNIDKPGKGGWYFPRFRKKPVEGFKDYKNQNYVANVAYPHADILSEAITRKIGADWLVPSLLDVYDATLEDGPVREVLKNYWVHTKEKIFKTGYVIFQPKMEAKNGKFVYTGEHKPAKINQLNVVETLESTGHFESGKNINSGGITFDGDGVASVRSDWDWGGGRLYANALWPLDRNDCGVAAFVNAGKKPKIRKITDEQYSELLNLRKRVPELEVKARKYDSLMKYLKDNA